MKAGDVVALCYSGTHGTRRLRNVTVVKVMKTFIEIEDGDRFSAVDGRQIRTADGGKGFKNYYLDTQVSYWDGHEARQKALQELRTKFENLASAANSRNWEQVKACFNELANFIDE